MLLRVGIAARVAQPNVVTAVRQNEGCAGRLKVGESTRFQRACRRLTQRSVRRVDEPVGVAVEQAVLEEDGPLGALLLRGGRPAVRDAVHPLHNRKQRNEMRK